MIDAYMSLQSAYVEGKITADQYRVALTGKIAREHYASAPLIDMDKDSPNYGMRTNSIKSMDAWHCHYCGSLVPNNLYKCPSCAGERR